MSDPLVLVATFGAPHGVKGEVRLKAYTADPRSLVAYSPLRSRDGRAFTIMSLRPQGEVFVARVKELVDRTAAEAVTRLDLFVPRERLPAPEDEDEFLHADLVGLAVVSTAGEAIGTIVGVYDFGAGDVLDVVRPGRKGVMIPFTKAVVPIVDVAGGKLVVEPPPGLLDDEAPPERG